MTTPDIGHIFVQPPARASRVPAPPPEPEPAAIELLIDGAAVTVPAGSTILEAARCWDRHPDPVHSRASPRSTSAAVRGRGERVPRLCGLLAAVEPGMEVLTTAAVRHSPRMVLELLGLVDLRWRAGRPDGRSPATRSGTARSRRGSGTPPRSRRSPSPSRSTTTCTCATTRAASCVHVRRGERRGSPEHVRDLGRRPRFGARNATSTMCRCRVRLRVLRHLHRRCPTGPSCSAPARVRLLGTWDRRAGEDGHDLSLLRRRLHARPARADNSIVKETSPLDSTASRPLCVKGSFGFDFVQLRPKGEAEGWPRG